MADKTMVIETWCCPTPGCGDYYGASGAGDLASKPTHPKVEHRHALRQQTGSDVKHSRAQCPTCRASNPPLLVERVLVRVRVNVPAAPEATPEAA